MCVLCAFYEQGEILPCVGGGDCRRPLEIIDESTGCEVCKDPSCTCVSLFDNLYPSDQELLKLYLDYVYPPHVLSFMIEQWLKRSASDGYPPPSFCRAMRKHPKCPE